LQLTTNMTETGKMKARAERKRRLEAELRENLKRRKLQARGRDAAQPQPRRVDNGHSGLNDGDPER
jgi:hypothetical protein